MTDTDINPISTIAQMVRDAEKHADDGAADRIRSQEYYDGVMKDTPADTGRSQQVSMDLRSNIKKVLPSIMRTIFGSDDVVEYEPVGPGDEEHSEQASDYVNRVIVPEAKVRRHIEDAIHDALQQRNGILKWWWEEKKEVRVSDHTGLDEFQFAELVSDDNVEVLEHSEIVEMMPGVDEMGQPAEQPVVFHDVKIKRIEAKGRVRVACVPRERFLIHPDALDVQDSILTGEKCRLTRSDLVAMGYDRDTVMGLSHGEDDDEEDTVRRDAVLDADEGHKPNEVVDYYDVFVRYDMDGDGIAELRHMCFGGGLSERNLLLDEPADEIQFCDVKVMARSHQWEGISLADDLMPIQRVKTVLLRQTIDNLYWQNNPQPIMQDGAIKNPDAVFNPEFGKPIRVQQGTPVSEAMTFGQIPFVAQQSFAMLEYMDQEAQDRTGISDASAGLAPDALQNMTATASEMINQAGIGQTEMMVRTVAEGLEKFFKGILRLIIRHQDKPRVLRLRGDWAEFDPRHWNAEMDCAVNVGLGAGTRERDMMMMQYVMGLQEKLLMSMGPNNPFVKPDNLWNALSKSCEAAGLRTPSMYFTEPDPQEVQALLEQAANQGNAEAEAKMAEAQIDAQLEQQKAQQKAQLDRQAAQAEAQRKREQMAAEIQMRREQMAAEMQLKREQMQAEAQLKREQMQYEAQMRVRMGGASGMSDVRMGGAVG